MIEGFMKKNLTIVNRKDYKHVVYSAIKSVDEEAVVNIVTANQLKIKGISAIESNLALDHELVITVRGKEKFVVMDMQHYNYLRECELDAVLHETKADYRAGKFVTESVEQHIQRVTK